MVSGRMGKRHKEIEFFQNAKNMPMVYVGILLGWSII